MEKRILIIAPVPLLPITQGNQVRIYHIVNFLQDNGFIIDYLVASRSSKLSPATIALHTQHHINIFSASTIKPTFIILRAIEKILHLFSYNYSLTANIDFWYSSKVDHIIQILIAKSNYHTVLINYVFLSKACLNFTKNTMKIIDSHDCFSQRKLAFQRANIKPQWFTTNQENEQKGMNRADTILAISELDRSHLQALTVRPVVTLSHLMQPTLPPPPNMPNILLMIASNHPFNRQGFKFFIDQILPLVIQKIPTITVNIIGSLGKHISQPLNLPVNFIAPQNDLNKYYQQASVIVNPVLFGSGISIKSYEALSYGRPLITTHKGAIGLETGINIAFLVADKKQHFANHIIDVLQSHDKRQLSQQAFALATHIYQDNILTLQQIFNIK